VWEMICHHTYKCHGVPVDLSFYDSHGTTDAQFLPDGATPGSGALRFSPGNRVRVATNAGWSRLGGVRAEFIARTTHSHELQGLIEADGAFAVYLQNGFLFASFNANPSVNGGVGWDTLGTYHDGLEFPGYRIPVGQWLRLIFEHDGFMQMRLLVDDEPVTRRRTVLSSIRGVGPKGICIGSGFGPNQTFGGDIDEIRVWRLDPKRMQRQFLERPFDETTANCWAGHLQSLLAALKAQGQCAEAVTRDIKAAFDRFMRAIDALGPETRQRNEFIRQRYAELWRKGDLDGTEMRNLISAWCAWLRLVGIAPEGDDAFLALERSDCWATIRQDLRGLDCDPQVRALLHSMLHECRPRITPDLERGDRVAGGHAEARLTPGADA
jgi:hypothetical protein